MHKDKDYNFKKKPPSKFRITSSQIARVTNTRSTLNNQTSKVLISIKLFEGIASQFETQLNDKDEVQLYIKELKCKGQGIKTNIVINLKEQIKKSKEAAIFYKQIKKKIKKFNEVFRKSGEKQLLSREIILQSKIKEDEQVPSKNTESLIITNNEISYIKFLESLSNGISKKSVIEYFKKQKIKSDKFLNLIYPPLQIEQELFEIQ